MQIEITKATSVKVGEVEYTPTELEKMKVKDLLKLLPVICDDEKTTKNCKRMRKPKLVAELVALAVQKTLKTYASGQVKVPNDAEQAAAQTAAKLLRIGYDITDLEVATPASLTLTLAAKSILAQEEGEEVMHDGKLTWWEQMLLIDTIARPDMSATVSRIMKGEDRPGLDANDNAWEVVQTAFNDFILNDGVTEDGQKFRKCTVRALKKAWTEITSAFMPIVRNYLASGQQGGPDLDGNVDFQDHVKWAFENPEHFVDFAKFSKHGSISPKVLDHMFRVTSDFPSLSPMTVRLAVGGVDGDTVAPTDVPAPRNGRSKRRKSSRDSQRQTQLEAAYTLQCEAERMNAHASEAFTTMQMLGETTLPEDIKRIYRERLQVLFQTARSTVASGSSSAAASSSASSPAAASSSASSSTAASSSASSSAAASSSASSPAASSSSA